MCIYYVWVRVCVGGSVFARLCAVVQKVSSNWFRSCGAVQANGVPLASDKLQRQQRKRKQKEQQMQEEEEEKGDEE